jgi:hypothetical protein
MVSLGVLMVVYSYPIVRLIGHIDWAEKTFGVGGTYTFMKLFGIVLILAGFYFLVKF